MARKKMQEPERWITVNGQHLPVYPGGVIGQPGQKEPKKDTTSKNNGNHWKDVNNYRDRLNAAKTEEEREKVLDEMDEAWKRIDHDKSLSDVEKNQLQSHMRDTRSAKTGIANNGTKTTSRNADDIYNERKNIKGNTQEEATRREKLSEELSRTVVSGMKSGEVYKVPSGKGYEELRYVGSEMKNNRAYATFETPNKSRTGIVKEGSDLYGIQSMKSSQPATTSRNARYDTSRSNKTETTGTKKSTLSDSTLSNMTTSKLEELLKNSSNLTGAQLSTIRSILKKRQDDEDLYRQSLRW